MSDPPAIDSSSTPEIRLRLEPGLTRKNAVDGAWWPTSRDLVAELPGLVAAMPRSAGAVERVAFGRAWWDPVPRRTRGWVDGRRIALGGFVPFADGIVWVATSTTGYTPIFLLVVPPDTAPERAADILRRAGDPENHEGPDDLLAEQRPSAPPASPSTTAVPARG